MYRRLFYSFLKEFLDASSHLYKRVCPSSVGPSVGRSVTLLVALLRKMPKIENFECRNNLDGIEFINLMYNISIRGYAQKFMRTHRWPLGLVNLYTAIVTFTLYSPPLGRDGGRRRRGCNGTTMNAVKLRSAFRVLGLTIAGFVRGPSPWVQLMKCKKKNEL